MDRSETTNAPRPVRPWSLRLRGLAANLPRRGRRQASSVAVLLGIAPPDPIAKRHRMMTPHGREVIFRSDNARSHRWHCARICPSAEQKAMRKSFISQARDTFSARKPVYCRTGTTDTASYSIVGLNAVRESYVVTIASTSPPSE